MSVHVTNVRLFTTTDDSRIRMASFCFFPQLKEIHNFKEDFRIYSPPVAKISLFLFLGVKEGGEMYFVLNTAHLRSVTRPQSSLSVSSFLVRKT